MKVDIIEGRAWEHCREMMLEDTELKKIDAEFYDLLDGVNEEVAANLEEAYLEYGTRAIELAYLQGIKDAKEK